jgi:putative transposase
MKSEMIDGLAPKRNSYMEMGGIYFWTATINKWQHLMREDRYKEVVISSLTYLVQNGKMDVFGFVIMPNHIHLVWRPNAMNGKESPQGSFLKYTAHQFKKMLKQEDAARLEAYKSDAANKAYEFWQRDPLAISLYSRKVAVQKLKYIHNNPLAKHWKLADDPCGYKYSSAKYYEMNKKNFSFLNDLYSVL